MDARFVHRVRSVDGANTESATLCDLIFGAAARAAVVRAANRSSKCSRPAALVGVPVAFVNGEPRTDLILTRTDSLSGDAEEDSAHG
jgi:precorrin isomerase